MVAKFVFSIDCEGKWGIADRGEQRLGHLTSDRLLAAYNEILMVLNRNKIRASFGFVSALCMSRDWLHEKLYCAESSVYYAGKDWLVQARDDFLKNDYSGWSEPALVKLVQSHGEQHICSHGGFHVPYDEEKTPKASIAEDIEVIKASRMVLGLSLDILIFPRNIIGYRECLAGAGFKAFRGLDKSESVPGLVGKAYRIANEFLSMDCADLKLVVKNQEGPLVQLSSAKFLNSKIGVRKFVPTHVTKNRIDTLVRYAVTQGVTVHFYTHPHNFISDPSMLEKHAYLMGVVAKYARSGDLKVMTMEDELNEISC